MHDFVFAFRQFRKTPSFVLAVVVTLALGIGANTAIFTLVHAVLLRSLPVQDPKMLFRIGDQDMSGQSDGFPDGSGSGDFSVFSWDAYQHLRQTVPALHQMAAMQSNSSGMNIRRGSEPARSQLTEFVSGNYFETFGVGAFAGRALRPADDTPAAAPVAVMSFAAWQSDYASDPRVVGQSFIIESHPVTVVGIAPPGFFGDRLVARPPDFWLPLSVEPLLGGNVSILHQPSTSWLDLIARLPRDTKTGPLAEQTSSELRHWLMTIPAYRAGRGSALIPRQHVVLVPGGAGIQQLQERESKGLYLLMAICLLVLLVACANVANLLLAKGAAQRADLALRIALGASRVRLIRQIVVESLMLACLGGLAGLALAYSGTRLILSLAFPDAPHLPISANPSVPVLLFAFGLSLLTGLVFGVLPALSTSHADPAEALRGANRSTRDRVSLPQRSLVVFQAALSLLLLVSAGLFTRSLRNLQHQDLGVQTDSRYIVHFDPQGAGYTAATLPSLYTALHDRFAATPGMAAVGLALYSPLEQTSWGAGVVIRGRQDGASNQPSSAVWDRTSIEYFQAVGEPLIQGRSFTEDDTATSRRVALVNRAFVAKFLPGEEVIGRRFGSDSSNPANDFEIVGVVADAKYIDPAKPAEPMYFLPITQALPRPANRSAPPDDLSMYLNAIVLSFKTPPANVDSLVHRTFAEINPDLPVVSLQSFSYQVAGNFNENVLLSRLADLFGLLALLLAAVGIYSVTSYQVNRRRNEIGVRMALGATRGNVQWMVLREALKQVGTGLVIGVPLAVLGAHLIGSQLYKLSSYDPPSLLLATAVLFAAAALASLVPSYRAASIEPVTALRID